MNDIADHRPPRITTTLSRRWVADGCGKEICQRGDTRALREHLVALERLYRRHIAIEDLDLFRWRTAR